MYEHFLFSFQALRHGDNITTVWNDMIKAGHKPTTRTYTIMMKGNQTMRDLDTMEAFWEMMRQAGLQPDGYAWSTKIFGLLKSKKSQHLKLGMAALEQMGQEWVTAATQAYHGTSKRGGKKGSQTPATPTRVDRQELLTRFPEEHVNGIPRPNAVIMNAAIMALAASRDSLISQALQWGRSFGIEPDLKTYNALINVSMRHGSADEAMSILKKMKERGIQADSTTMTVMTSAMFEGGIFDGLDAEEVGERVVSLMREVDQFSEGGMDEKGYALIMDRLLKRYNNHAAAQQVLEHMLARGLKPNAEMYTIIMTSYFQQSPLNFAAMESLWSRIRSENSGYGALLDNTFYDRMIELSAQHHSVIGTKQMVSFMEAMEKDGKRPSWRALEAAARALDEAGERDRLALLVDRAKRLREDVPDSKQAYGVRAFWDFIASTHLGGSVA
ncbi:hypothetical protein BDY17DRAFT_312661 [Neohortaea acidophila]|uniref:Pentacotripeptide-repeat region of PRORP domain-containing protein n=1 Tax=Neohortaea acidophila TaxID=245834 RepID=A0A6A6PLN4_9PEZI|nr:uncharacterized protein BDY17DRAFT_312661 [Neohortaea acidophila]KAF2480845.1 hypothetical protein BDY17DRAFT_312661 [Neohortaea acidophila]